MNCRPGAFMLHGDVVVDPINSNASLPDAERARGRASRVAFTLVELLVVVSIIALLVGILLPSLGGARRSGQRASCAANLKQIGTGMRMYLNDSNDYLPNAPPLPSLQPPTGVEQPGIATVLKPYLTEHVGKQDDVFRCPGDVPGKTRRDPPNDDKSFYDTEGTSYAYNFRLSGEKLYEVVRRDWVKQYYGGQVNEEQIWIMRDYVAFHGKPGKPGASNYLYVDGHVSDLER